MKWSFFSIKKKKLFIGMHIQVCIWSRCKYGNIYGIEIRVSKHISYNWILRFNYDCPLGCIIEKNLKTYEVKNWVYTLHESDTQAVSYTYRRPSNCRIKLMFPFVRETLPRSHSLSLSLITSIQRCTIDYFSQIFF